MDLETVAFWAIVFGVLAMVIGERHGRTALQGFLLGAFLGPIGVILAFRQIEKDDHDGS